MRDLRHFSGMGRRMECAPPISYTAVTVGAADVVGMSLPTQKCTQRLIQEQWHLQCQVHLATSVFVSPKLPNVRSKMPL